MSRKTKNQSNILVNPTEYASMLENLEPDQDVTEIERLEYHLAHLLRLGGAITYLDENDDHVIEDGSGIRPFPEGSEFPSPPECAELQIRELAFQYGVDGNQNDWCEGVSADADDDVQSDEIEQLLVGLRRLGTIDGTTLTKLHARYMEESDQV